MKLWPHQEQSYAFGKDLPAFIDGSDPGCVDCETEYLTPIGWKKICDYDEKDLVAEFHPSTFNIQFKKPLDYVVYPCTSMYHFKPSRGLDMMLSGEHRVLYYTNKEDHGKKSWNVTSARKYFKIARDTHIASAFNAPEQAGLDITDTELRLMVAVIADGHFANKTTRCIVRLKKQAKKDRLRKLLNELGIEFKERDCINEVIPGFSVFTFNTPYRDKVFNSKYWGCSKEQLRIITEEVVHWDGDRHKTFYTTIKDSADFIQYAASSCGWPSAITTAERKETDRKRPTEYIVHMRKDMNYLIGRMREASIKTRVPPKDGKKYCFTTETSFWLARRNGRIFATGNTGKTIVHAKIIEDFLENKGTRVVVACPKTLMRSAWKNEFEEYLPNIKIALAEAPAESRREAFAGDAQVVIINIDGLKWLAEQNKRTLKKWFGNKAMLVCDESHTLKNPNAQRTKAALKVAEYFVKRHVMSGTLAPNSVIELWSQAKIVDGGVRLGKRYTAFRNLMQKPVHRGPFTEWVDKPDSPSIVYGLLNDITIRHAFDDVMSHVPDMEQSIIYYDLPKKHRKNYDELRSTMYLEHKGEVISAVNAATLANKLLQCASGAAYANEKEWAVFDSGRYELIADLVDGRKSCLVFWQWKHQRDEIIKELKKKKITYGCLDGSVKSPTKREQAVKDFQSGNTKCLLMHPETGAFGLTLTKGTTVIWASPVYEAKAKIQGDARIRRGIQDQKTESIVILGRDTRDIDAYRVFSGKRDRLTALNNLFAES